MRAIVGEKGRVIGAVSGGAVSTVEARLVKETIEDRFHVVLVDGDLIRLNGCEIVRGTLTNYEASTLPLSTQETAKELAATTASSLNEGELLQRSLCPDVIKSIAFKGLSQTIKPYHNFNGLLENLHLKAIEPPCELFKDEVHVVGTNLGISEDVV
ncbi:hypothetical protein GP486_001986 [Trichoglossum hirsutum]|uniref:GMPS ATP-PPase domain-containing protein n=1 Tax=Trichoglossum hirsutum TaxID=265104 RepID=A0A9P8RS44_9PEZI|nr:hypothetical protein GP486_001986 [Trichoglossum hirsutum]